MERNKISVLVPIILLLIAVIVIGGCDGNSSRVIKGAISSARSEGYAVYENTAKIIESDGYGRYFVTLTARFYTQDIPLIVWVRLSGEYQHHYIVCPDTFETAAERSEWISNIKLSNNWGISAK